MTNAAPGARADDTEAPAPREASAAAADVPAGQLVCRTKSLTEGTTELFLEWKGETASGVLRRAVPSGMVYDQRVRAERHNGAIVVDEPSATDLASHAAMVLSRNGKQLIRLGGSDQRWLSCD
jgi:hypothetical protein